MVKDLFLIKSKGLEVSIAPDETRLADIRQMASEYEYSLYLSTLDSSDLKLIAYTLPDWMARNPVWSPDGNWSIIGMTKMAKPAGEIEHALMFCLPAKFSISRLEERFLRGFHRFCLVITLIIVLHLSVSRHSV